MFPPDFQVIQVWRLGFSSVHSNKGDYAAFLLIFNGFALWRLAKSTLHSHFAARVNTWKSKPSHPKTMKISRKHTMCEGVNAFFGKSNAYTRARMMGQFHAMGMVGEIARTSRRVVFLNRRFVFPTRRLVFSNYRVVKPTPGFVKPTPGLVTAIRREKRIEKGCWRGANCTKHRFSFEG